MRRRYDALPMPIVSGTVRIGTGTMHGIPVPVPFRNRTYQYRTLPYRTAPGSRGPRPSVKTEAQQRAEVIRRFFRFLLLVRAVLLLVSR